MKHRDDKQQNQPKTAAPQQPGRGQPGQPNQPFQKGQPAKQGSNPGQTRGR